MALAISAAGVLLFSAYTAHDVHRFRTPAPTCTSEDELSRLALIGAVVLYLDLANLIMDVLNLMRSAGGDVLGGW